MKQQAEKRARQKGKVGDRKEGSQDKKAEAAAAAKAAMEDEIARAAAEAAAMSLRCVLRVGGLRGEGGGVECRSQEGLSLCGEATLPHPQQTKRNAHPNPN